VGLDMYLKAEKYVAGWQHAAEDERNEYDRLVETFGMKDFVEESSPSAFVAFTVGYWRKANHIHSWFVRECQGGVDECQKTDVSIGKLKELRETCLRVLASTELVPGEIYAGTIYNKEHPQGHRQIEPGKVLADPSLAAELLAPEEGFFFGSVEYDQWYWEDLQATVAIVDRCVALAARADKGEWWDFEYQSSW